MSVALDMSRNTPRLNNLPTNLMSFRHQANDCACLYDTPDATKYVLDGFVNGESFVFITDNRENLVNQVNMLNQYDNVEMLVYNMEICLLRQGFDNDINEL